ncbi:hypothetical protein ZTR_05479 [Talaromyces verruculosus]|nr:hypothetical protein ZTR_05479 [Talaromyces verruculosus]
MDQQRVFDVPGLEATPGHMSAALHEMRQVTDELLIHGCGYEANEIGRLTLEIIKQWHNALDRINGAVAVSQHAHLPPIPGLFPLPSLAATRILAFMNDQGSVMSAEQGHAEPAEDVKDEQASHLLPVPTTAPEPVPEVGATWAHVASTSAKPQVPERPVSRANRGGRHNAGPSVPVHTVSRPATALGGVAEASSSRAPSRHNDNNGNGILEDGKAGIVVINGPIETIKNILSYVSARIHEGPIYDMSMNKDQEVVIIFQYALHAQIFVDRNTEAVATRGESVFGPGNWIVTLGRPMEWTDTLRRMAHPHRERRRITFVKSRLFADHTSFMKWVREVQDVAGCANVDFVWAFNTGNGKSPFVATSRKVMQTFSHWHATRSCYEDLVVSYSSDPCEKELQLTTQLRYHVQPAHRRFEKVAPNENGRHYYHGRK